MTEEEVDELREAMREAETRGSFEEPEQSIEFDAHIINPSEYVEKIAPTATREIVLANLESRDRRPTVREVNNLFEIAHFIRVYAERFGLIDSKDENGEAGIGTSFKERGYRLLGLSRSVGMKQQQELRTRRVNVGGEGQKKRWSWR